MEYSFTGLHNERDAGEFIRHHARVVEYHSPYMEKAEECNRFARNQHHSEADLAAYKKKDKHPVNFPGQVSPMRTVVGQFIQSKYDMKPTPVEPNDQATADPLVALHHWTADSAGAHLKDIEVFKQTYVSGAAYQESYVEIIHGKRPSICVTNQNRFAIYWDPNSRDLINREDAEFWDRETWLSYQDILDRFPEKAATIRAALEGNAETEKGGYEQVTLYADRGHESRSARNGTYKVVERFYRVRKRMQFGVGQKGHRLDIGEEVQAETMEAFQKDYPGYAIRSTPMEYMYYAAACEQVSSSEFLTNGPYHWHPRDVRTGRILWTLVECVAETLGGEATGFIEPEMGPLKLIDAMMSNILHAARHSVSTSMFYDPSKFRTDDEAQDFVRNASDGNKRFPVKPGALDNGGKAAESVPQAITTQDNKDVLNFSSAMLEDVSSAPKPLRGAVEASGTPAAQTEMRIQQSFTQLLGLITNWKHFLTKRGKLWYAMWREFFPNEMTIRVIEKKNPSDPGWMKINEPIGVDDEGNIVRAMDINSALFDITFTESVQSQTARDKTRASLVQVMNMAAQLDPVMAAWLVMRIMELDDIDEDDKQFLKSHMQVIKQAEAEKAAAEQEKAQLERAGTMQNLAQAEAEQTTIPPASSGAQPPRPPRSSDQVLQPA